MFIARFYIFLSTSSLANNVVKVLERRLIVQFLVLKENNLLN
jgi:hypothetical protein